jgi:hypothetical protein
MAEPLPSSILCKECNLSEFDLLKGDGYMLKESWEALFHSSQDGCDLCDKIFWAAENES